MKKFIKNNGITLVALVVTIVVLLILAGVSISLVLGDNGLISQAKQSANATKEAVENDYNMLEKLESQIADFSSEYNKVNKPKLKTGMTPVYFVENGSTYETKTTNESDSNWYDYEAKHWANAQTADGSMWVWIPRFAYKLNNDNKTFDVKFLIETTDYFYNDKGELEKATRATADSSPDTTKEYAVHPAFANESDIGFRDGGWDSELTGIWVAKFEAGQPTSNGNTTENKKSSVKYTQTSVWTTTTENGTNNENNMTSRNWLDGAYGSTTTKISYPIFQGAVYSMNYINIREAFAICSVLTENGNIYGLSDDTDSHLMKNSEWGACSYLAHSKYGLNMDDVYINNITLSSGGSSTDKASGNEYASVYAVAGVESSTGANTGSVVLTNKSQINNRSERETKNIRLWSDTDGGKSSTTGNVYGIFDMSGGLWERTADYIANGKNTDYGNTNYAYTTDTDSKYKRMFTADTSNKLVTTSTKYATVYPYDSANDTGSDYDSVGVKHWEYNKTLKTIIYGDAVFETATNGKYSTSYYGDYSNFPALDNPFFARGGRWYIGGNAGLFAFDRRVGGAGYADGFRAVLV